MNSNDPNIERIDYWRRAGDRRQLTEFLRVGHIRMVAGHGQPGTRIKRRRLAVVLLALILLGIGFFFVLF